MLQYAGMNGLLPITNNIQTSVRKLKIIEISPEREKIGKFGIQNAANTNILAQKIMTEKPGVFITCDKGDKKGNTNIVINP